MAEPIIFILGIVISCIFFTGAWIYLRMLRDVLHEKIITKDNLLTEENIQSVYISSNEFAPKKVNISVVQ